jgi:hypothetical protein
MTQSSTRFDLTTERSREARMNRIRRVSRTMATACLATSGLLAAAMLLYWTIASARTLFSHAGISNVPVTEIDFSIRALAFGVSMVPLGALIYGLLNARRCFGAFAAGQIFSTEPIRRLEAFSAGVAASALLKPFAGAALSVLLSFNNPAGGKALALNIGSDTLIALIFAGTIATIAWVMTEALDIVDENKLFV